MWTRETRGRMAEIERHTKRYPTDLTDAEWAHVEPFLPKPARTGRRREVDLREVLNAIRYVARTGCGWRTLPKDFPPWQTVYWFSDRGDVKDIGSLHPPGSWFSPKSVRKRSAS